MLPGLRKQPRTKRSDIGAFRFDRRINEPVAVIVRDANLERLNEPSRSQIALGEGQSAWRDTLSLCRRQNERRVVECEAGANVEIVDPGMVAPTPPAIARRVTAAGGRYGIAAATARVRCLTASDQRQAGCGLRRWRNGDALVFAVGDGDMRLNSSRTQEHFLAIPLWPNALHVLLIPLSAAVGLVHDLVHRVGLRALVVLAGNLFCHEVAAWPP